MLVPWCPAVNALVRVRTVAKATWRLGWMYPERLRRLVPRSHSRRNGSSATCIRRIATNALTMPDAKEKLRRRSQSRKPFIASALVFEPKSETRLRRRTADLGPEGCFIDTLNPFAPGTMLKVRIDKGGASLETWAKVVYSLTSMVL